MLAVPTQCAAHYSTASYDTIIPHDILCCTVLYCAVQLYDTALDWGKACNDGREFELEREYHTRISEGFVPPLTVEGALQLYHTL